VTEHFLDANIIIVSLPIVLQFILSG